MERLRSRPEYPTITVDDRGNIAITMDRHYHFTDPWYPAMVKKALYTQSDLIRREKANKNVQAILCLLVYDVMMRAWERGHLVRLTDAEVAQMGTVVFGRIG